MTQTVFNRIEKKYLLPEFLYLELMDQLKPYMEIDSYGLHTICNIYYDTPDHLLIRRSIEKPKYKEKLRLRSYGIPSDDSKVFLEIKKKYKKVVNKRRISLTLTEAYDYLDHGIRPQKDSQILRELDFFLSRYPLQKSLYLAYDRIALFGKEDPDFRATFDTRIRSRHVDMNLEKGDMGIQLLPDGYRLMETKVMGATPLWFAHILSSLSLYPISFSKYGNIYKNELGVWDFQKLTAHCTENWNHVKTGGKLVC